MSFVTLLVFLLLPYVVLGQLVAAFFWLYWGGGSGLSDRAVQLESERAIWSWPAVWLCGGFVLLQHLAAILLPTTFAALVATPLRLFIIECLGLCAGLSLTFVLGLLAWRRLRVPSLSPLRTALDLTALGLFLASAACGVAVATQLRWGAAWFPSVVSPYFRSLFSLAPDASALVAAPLLVQLHVAFSFLALALFPYTSAPRQLVRSFSPAAPRTAGLTGGA